MAITDAFVLPADVVLVPVENLPVRVREQVQGEDGDYAITRPHSRTPSRIIDQQAAALVKAFRTPKTIVEAVIGYSRETNADPEATLEEAFPLLQRLLASHLLVPADSEDAARIGALCEPGDRIADCEVIDVVQVLEDTELYQVRRGNGDLAALKLLRPTASHSAQRGFEREAAILRHLDGRVNPALLDVGAFQERPYLLLEWCPGVDAATAAAEFRQYGAHDAGNLLDLCAHILDAYAYLHAQHVIHSDVHPRNVLVGADSSIKIVDYGLARVDGLASNLARARRGGVAFFFEPEYARQPRRAKASSMAGEQYGLAAMLYLLCTGEHYLDFSLEKHALLRQIAEEPPLAFARRNRAPWPELECVLGKALRKDPADRFASVSEFANALRAIALPAEPFDAATMGTPGSTPALTALVNEMVEHLGLASPLLAAGLTEAPTASLTYGAAGIAYALYRIACYREDPSLLAAADVWCDHAVRRLPDSDAFYNSTLELTPEIIGQLTPYHAESGVHAVQFLISHAMGDQVSAQTALEAFARTSRIPCENLDVTLGRSGSLLASSLLLDALPTESEMLHPAPLLQLGDELMTGIWERIDSFAPIRECREIQYSGAAHGWAGILYAILSWCRSAGRALPATARERLDQLADCAEPSAHGVRWKWHMRKGGRRRMDDYMAGWCNGSAGFVYLWTLAHRMLADERYLALAEKAGWNAWEADAQIGNLCCGFGGQAYALLSLFKYTGERSWLERAQAVAARAAAAVVSQPGDLLLRRESLYKGALGVALLGVELMKPDFAAMPFFEREGWPSGSSPADVP